jgi:hypothetical protein
MIEGSVVSRTLLCRRKIYWEVSVKETIRYPTPSDLSSPLRILRYGSLILQNILGISWYHLI